MSNKWIPEWATHYNINPMNPADDGAFYVVFYNTHTDISDTKPVGEHHQALIDEICGQIRDKPLSERIKQPRYTDDKGEDWIDECERTLTWPEFVGAMKFTIGKYLRRLGKKDDELQELEKVADYAERLLRAAKRRIDTHV